MPIQSVYDRFVTCQNLENYIEEQTRVIANRQANLRETFIWQEQDYNDVMETLNKFELFPDID